MPLHRSTTPANARTAVTWKSSAVTVATVSTTGVVTPVGAGTAIITATTAGGLSATSAVTVSAFPLPVFSPVGGIPETTFAHVTLTSSVPGASIRYTIDGTNPTTTTGTVYSSQITVQATTTIKAIAYTTTSSSAVASATYTIPSNISTSFPVSTPAAFSVTVSGSASILRTSPTSSYTSDYNGGTTSVIDTYQWYIDGIAITGATTATLSLDVSSPVVSGGLHLLTLVIKDTTGVCYSGDFTFTVKN